MNMLLQRQMSFSCSVDVLMEHSSFSVTKHSYLCQSSLTLIFGYILATFYYAPLLLKCRNPHRVLPSSFLCVVKATRSPRPMQVDEKHPWRRKVTCPGLRPKLACGSLCKHESELQCRFLCSSLIIALFAWTNIIFHFHLMYYFIIFNLLMVESAFRLQCD